MVDGTFDIAFNSFDGVFGCFRSFLVMLTVFDSLLFSKVYTSFSNVLRGGRILPGMWSKNKEKAENTFKK